MEVLDCLECALKSVWGEGLHQHLLALVADEGPHNVVMREAGFPVITDLCHLQDRMTAKGHVDVVLEDVHKTSVFQKANYKDKFSLIRRIANDLPRSPWSRTEAELKVLERVVVLRFDVGEGGKEIGHSGVKHNGRGFQQKQKPQRAITGEPQTPEKGRVPPMPY
ncbi:uncharacterized protein [Drosophila kikkawai]|uniref:Uncharacterized protein n=1 Tax=Drosophila kikkawai TaxID=30033 RepID=A0ABM4GGI9_DROKI